MSEVSRWSTAALGVGLGISLIAGCDAGGSHNATPGAPAITRCYDSPTPETTPTYPLPPSPGTLPPLPDAAGKSRHQFQKEFEAWQQAEVAWQAQSDTVAKAAEDQYKPLLIPVSKGIPQGSPVVVPDAEVDKATNALVEITVNHNRSKGTGFIVEHKGEQFVVTAAHVIGTAALKDTIITTQDGRHTEPTGGCYMFETKQNLASLSTNTESADLQDIDLAVLKLATPLTAQPLPINTTRPRGGQWVDFVNYQANYGPTKSKFSLDYIPHPASYVGVVTPKTLSTQLKVVTGVQDLGKVVTVGQMDATHLRPGASGGPVIENGAVVGVSVQATKESLYAGSDTLALYNIAFPGADQNEHTGFQPTLASVVPAIEIQRALDSPAHN